MTISTTAPTSNLSIVTAFLETRRSGVLDSVAVLERTPLGNIIRAQEIGKGIEEKAITKFREQFPTAICECKVG
jgi:hypothetical protein